MICGECGRSDDQHYRAPWLDHDFRTAPCAIVPEIESLAHFRELQAEAREEDEGERAAMQEENLRILLEVEKGQENDELKAMALISEALSPFGWAARKRILTWATSWAKSAPPPLSQD